MDKHEEQRRNAAFYRALEEAIGRLPAEVRASLYRPCAEACVRDGVLVEMRRQFEECGRDLDRQYAKYGRSPYFFADVIEPGRVYEMGYPRCLCPQVEAGFVTAPTIASVRARASSACWRSCCRTGISGWRRSIRCWKAGRSAVSGSRSARRGAGTAHPGDGRMFGAGCTP